MIGFIKVHNKSGKEFQISIDDISIFGESTSIPCGSHIVFKYGNSSIDVEESYSELCGLIEKSNNYIPVGS